MNLLIPPSVPSWTRDQLRAELHRLYSEAGFVIEPPEEGARTVAFVARQKPGVEGEGDLAVGCIADPDMPIVFRDEVMEFGSALSESGCAQGELITTGRFERAAIEAAREFPVRLVDGAALETVLNVQQPDAPPSEQPQVNPIARELSLAGREADIRLVRPLSPPPAESSPEDLSADLYGEDGWTPPPKRGLSERTIVALATGIASLVLALVYGGLYHRAEDAPLPQPVEVPEFQDASSEETRKHHEELLAGYGLSAGASEGATGLESLWEVRRQVVHRVDLLESLKAREEFEALAAELVAFVSSAREIGLDYAEMGAFQLKPTVKLASEGYGLENLDSPRAKLMQPPLLTEDDQSHILPYLRISDYRLKLVSEPIAVNQLLRDDQSTNGFETVRYEQSLRMLERRMWAEQEIDARRHAQAIVSLARAAAIANLDLVAECLGDVDALIQSLTVGRKIVDPESPFHGHTFKVYATAPEDLSIVKRFLEVRNGRLYYHERMDDLDVPPYHFRDPEKPETAHKAKGMAEDLIRHTARQILVNAGSRQRSLIPLAVSGG